MNRIASFLLGLSLVVAVLPSSVAANGVPVTIVLSYLDGVSNFGPRSSTGLSEFVARESELRLQATGLPRLNGEEYRVWVTNTATGQRMALSSFNSTADGRVNIDRVLDMTIPDGGWNLMFLSVEAEGSNPTEPDARRSLAGRWPEPSVAGGGRPAELPRTGGVTPTGYGSSPEQAAVLPVTILLGLVLALGIGVAYGRRTAGRGSL